MSLTPLTPEEILQQYGTRLNNIIGPNVLQDPAANRSSNLVRVMSVAALSLSDLMNAAEAAILQQNPLNLEGVALTNHGAARGIIRNTNTQSKTTIMVTGQQGVRLPAGAELRDRFGGRWLTEADIVLNSSGAGCAYGQGIACAENPGSFTLGDNELRYDNTTTPFIFSATNGIMLQIGGATENDDSYRNRIINRGPLINVNGTADNAKAALLAIDGVQFVRYEFVDTCIGTGPMFVIYGGNEQVICDTIELKSGISCNLVGDNDCASCSAVRYQRPCPVLLCLEVTLNDNCPLISQADLLALIISRSTEIARQTKLRANDFALLSGEIDSVRFRVKKPGLYCTENLGDAPVYPDPLSDSGGTIVFGTDDPTGLCGGSPECGTISDWLNSVEINPWEYFIMSPDQVTFLQSPGPVDDCTNCGDTSTVDPGLGGGGI